MSCPCPVISEHRRDSMMIIQAHRRRGILLHPRFRLALLGQKSFHRPPVRAARSFTLAAGWLCCSAPVCCCTLPRCSCHSLVLSSPTRYSLSYSTRLLHLQYYTLTTTAYSPRHYLHPAFLCHQQTLTGTTTPSNPQLPNTSSCPYRSLSPDSPALHIARPIAFHHRPSRLHKTRAARDTVKPNSTTSRS